MSRVRSVRNSQQPLLGHEVVNWSSTCPRLLRRLRAQATCTASTSFLGLVCGLSQELVIGAAVMKDPNVSQQRLVNVHQAKTHLSRLMDEAHKGETIVLAKAGRPWARLMPLEPTPAQRIPGRLSGLGPLLHPKPCLIRSLPSNWRTGTPAPCLRLHHCHDGQYGFYARQSCAAVVVVRPAANA